MTGSGQDGNTVEPFRKTISFDENSLDFLKEKQKLDFFDALSLASIGVDFEVTQVVDQTKGVHAMVPKALFKDGSAAGYWYQP